MGHLHPEGMFSRVVPVLPEREPSLANSLRRHRERVSLNPEAENRAVREPSSHLAGSVRHVHDDPEARHRPQNAALFIPVHREDVFMERIGHVLVAGPAVA